MGAQDVTLFADQGFNASRWRSGESPTLPSDLTTLTYTGQPFTPEGLTAEDETFTANMPYGEVFWEVFFETVFPEVTQGDFDAETSTGTAGGYYRNLFMIAAEDFYDSYFRGRDDLGSNMVGTLLSESTWNALTRDEQRITIYKYLDTRSEVKHKEFSERMLLNKLQARRENVFVWVAQLMISIMGSLQQNTINAGRYATRLAQTQKAISTEMASSTYSYQTLAHPEDYPRMALNENNGKELEDLRTFRNKIQKETDAASSFLESSNSGVETMGATSLQFLNKSKSLQSVFFHQA